MGGIGSGRRGQSGKDTTEDYRLLDVRRLQRDGLLTPKRFFSWTWTCEGRTVAWIRLEVHSDRLILAYSYRSGGSEWQPVTYPVQLEYTACALGGQRPWFRCPGVGCGRRVAIIYGGAMFVCRHCHRLVYACQRETIDDRAARRADKIRGKLRWELGILNGGGSKPKGMHWRTFERLTAGHDALVDESLAGMAQRFGLTNRLL